MSQIAATTAGDVEGREKGGCLLFAGIPYAAPPTGPLRFRPPEPHPGWSEVRAAKRFGPGAPQRQGEGLTAAPTKWDEDCLTLNVTTPAADGAARPVLVWIHGGGFRTGKGGIPWYNGAGFARRGDVVVVSINYRLGALGFAHVGDVAGDEFASSGLNGIRDQIAALEWVRDNIASFGGDPARVSIAGESAGGMSVGVLLGCPSAAGLCRGAIAQSGAAHHVIADAHARLVGRAFARELGVDDLEGLQSAPVGAILDAQGRVEETFEAEDAALSAEIGSMPFRPCVDGQILPAPPLDAIRAGAARDVRLLAGTNRDETTLFGYANVDEDRLSRIAGRFFGDPKPALDAYRAARPSASARELAIAVTTDQMFRIPALRLLEAHHGSGGAGYQYEFTWRSRAFGGRLGATHALEVPFAFDTLDAPGVDVFLGEGPRPTELASAMHAAWTAFVRDGDPACAPLPEWPRFAPDTRAVMELGDRCGVANDPEPGVRQLWDGIR